MKIKILYLFAILFAGLLFGSCSKQITGTWIVDKYATVLPGSDKKGVTLSNIGTMTFNEDGSGEKELGYNVLGISRNDTLPFNWEVTKEYITLRGGESALAKSWIIQKSSRVEQIWNSTDGENEIQILKLRRKVN